ncbi:MAG: prolipoprotein diacylglyceryl transferase [Alphaproteobacteria bacterium]|nr:prolipoprotein diacylglyceryl transferase [Alphaproteobacteria bacterium]
MLTALAFPAIDPVLFEFGPITVRWYALAYVAGLLLGWWYLRSLARRPPATAMTERQADDLLLWVTFGVLLGGRVGYVLIYNPAFYLDHPMEILAVWRGGMSFHGGLAGVLLAIGLYCWRHGLSFLAVGDLVACATPIGLFLGRIANFINGELYGRATDLPWGFIFPNGGPKARHPSQLYEALLEGALLFLLLYALVRYADALKKPGLVGGAFLGGYAVLRFGVEYVRQPDSQIGLIGPGLTMGQTLSLPLFFAGLALFLWAWRKRPV